MSTPFRLLRRITLAACASALLLISLSSCAKNEPAARNSTAATPTPATDAPDEIIATVNGRPISRKLYEMFLRNGREELGINPETTEGRRKFDELREGIVSELIDRALIAQEAERRGFLVTPERLAQTEQREITKLGGEARFAEYIRTHGFTPDEYRASIRDMIYSELMTEEAVRQASVSDEEIKTYYDSHRRDATLQLPERVAAAHILISARPQAISQELQREKNLTGDALAVAVREESARRRARAAEVRREAARAGGTDFARLAREHSDDAATRERGGDLGAPFAHGAHTRAFDDAAFKLKPGEVSEVIETEYGYHIIKLTGREPARSVRLEEAAPDIRARLLAQKQARLLALWLKEARGKALVAIKEPYRFGALRTEFPAS